MYIQSKGRFMDSWHPKNGDGRSDIPTCIGLSPVETAMLAGMMLGFVGALVLLLSIQGCT